MQRIALPDESFRGTILGSRFRLMELIRTEKTGDTFRVEDLWNPERILQAKAYQLHGLSAKERKYRVRNLKRMSGKEHFLCCVDHGRMKYCINDSISVEARISQSLSAKKGTRRFWKRGSKQFTTDFPPLLSHGKCTNFSQSFSILNTTQGLLIDEGILFYVILKGCFRAEYWRAMAFKLTTKRSWQLPMPDIMQLLVSEQSLVFKAVT